MTSTERSEASRLSAWKVLILLVPAVLELAFFRWYLHSVLGLRFGFGHTTDFDFFLPVPIAFFVLIRVLEQARPLVLSLQPRSLFANALAAVLFALLNGFSDFFPDPYLFTACWFLLLGVMVASSLCFFVGASFYLKNPNRWAFLPAILIASSVYFCMNCPNGVWKSFLKLTGTALQGMSVILAPLHITTSSHCSSGGYLSVSHPLLSLRLGKGCSGMDAFFYGTFLFCVLFALFRRMYSWVQWCVGYIGLVALAFALNLVRVILLFVIGILLKKMLGAATGTFLLKGVFHIHVGWVIYTIGFLVYMVLWLRWRSFPGRVALPLWARAAVNVVLGRQEPSRK